MSRPLRPASIRARDPAQPVAGAAAGEPHAASASMLQDRYGRCLAELSTRFLSLPTGELEREIVAGLESVGRIARADQVLLYDTLVPDSAEVRVHAWRSETGGLIYEPDRERRPEFAWSLDQLLAGRVIRIPSVAHLPPAAEAEQRDLERRGVRAMLGVPLLISGEFVGYLTLESTTAPRAWGDSEVELIGLAGNLFAGAIGRHQAERLAARQREVERRVAEVARRFLDCSVEDVDAEIRAALAAASEVAGADRAFLVSLEEGAPRLRATFEWAAPGVPAGSVRRLVARGASFVWALRELRRADLVHVPDVDQLEAGSPEREGLKALGVGSALGFSVRSAGTLMGFLAFEVVEGKKRWSNTEITQLGLLASLFASVLRRQQSEEGLAGQLAFERGVGDLSRRLLTLDDAASSGGLRSTLAQAADLAGAERSYLLSYPVGLVERFSAEQWCAPGVPEAEPVELPWATRSVLQGERLVVPSVDALPDDKRQCSGDLLARGVRSLLGFPIQQSGSPIGFVGFETFSHEKHWSEEEIAVLALVGEFFASALRRRSAEQALRRSQLQLLQAQKMEAVGRLAGGVAHDFNNLLTVILGNSESLRAALPPTAVGREDAEEIHRAAQRGAALTRRLLDFSSQPVEEPGRVDLAAVVAGLESLLSRLLPAGVELRVAPCRHPAWVEGSTSQLEQVLVNLVVNARNAMPAGGALEVRVSTRALERTEARDLGLRGPTKVVVLSVRDEGEGMEETTRARIFEPFFTTRDPGEGTGLGLSIVYSIVRQSHGAIDVRSKRGGGTTFQLFFPLVSPRSSHEPAVGPVEPHPGSGTVLLVEDEKSVRRLGRRLLERAGYTVLEAGDGLEALEVAEAHAGEIDLLVSDVVMPRLGGGDLARQLVAKRPGLRVLFISGYPHERDGSSLLPTTGFEILPKPFTGDRLLARIAELLAKPPETR